jgi:hypothetical protein
MHKITVVTPAGRKHYLALLKHYILKDDSIDEWHLWDNCRNQQDREYIYEISSEHKKIRIVSLPNVDGTNRSVNKFYSNCSVEDRFYIKVDDDIVYLPEGFGASLYSRALQDKGKYLWWSPLVVNNAVCSWLIKYHSKVSLSDVISCQASDYNGWRNPIFAERLHKIFLSSLEKGEKQKFEMQDFSVRLSRYSINCIGFWGEDVKKLGEQFCPLNVDDEEWISAILPSQINRYGKIVGNLIIVHFAFFTQEAYLLKSSILDSYYKIAGIKPEFYVIKKLSAKKRLRKMLKALANRLLGAEY